MSQYDREEEQLERDLADGRITQAEFNKQIRELHQAYREDARASAEQAYDNEMERW